ncbi:cutinase family protein [Nostocoides vanveenii]
MDVELADERDEAGEHLVMRASKVARWALATCAASGLVASPLTASAESTPAGSSGSAIGRAAVNPAQVSRLNALSPCQDIVFYGLRGSGEPLDDRTFDMGGKVFAAFNGLAAQLPGRRIAGEGIAYPAQAVEAVITRYYFEGIDVGVTSVMQGILRRSATCPRERYVISGYSQGAMVAHRAMFAMAKDSRYVNALSRTVAFLNIADGDRVANEMGRHYGTSKEGSFSFGVSWAVFGLDGNSYKPTKAKVPAALQPKWFSICDSGDIVCDAIKGAANPLGGVGIHTSHYGSDSTAVRDALRPIAQSVLAKAALPEMRLTTSQLPMPVLGASYSAQLQGLNGVAPYRFTLPSGQRLPAGLTMSSTGQVSGIPTSLSPAAFSVLVRDSKGQTIRPTVTFPMAITFDEVSLGSTVTTQYRANGYNFTSGLGMFTSGDGANPTSPVLSGSPLFQGPIEFTLVQPTGPTLPRSASNVRFDIGYLDAAGSIRISWYNATGALIGSTLTSTYGVAPITLAGSGITKVRMEQVFMGAEPAGYAIDNLIDW